MANPKFKPYYHKETGKFFTGYVMDLLWGANIRGESDYEEGDDYKVQHLRLRYAGYQRGRSAANMILKDEDGFSYLMSCSTFDTMMVCVTEMSSDKTVQAVQTQLGGLLFEGDFKQVKQGQNYFIAPNI